MLIKGKRVAKDLHGESIHVSRIRSSGKVKRQIDTASNEVFTFGEGPEEEEVQSYDDPTDDLDINTPDEYRSALEIAQYGTQKGGQIRLLYIAAVVAWTIIIMSLGIWRTGSLGWIILLIPYFVFASGFINAYTLSIEVERNVFQANYLSIGLIIILPLLTWIDRNYTGDKEQFVRVLIVAMVLVLMSMFDLWVNSRWLSFTKHLRSVFQTMAIGILIFALYTFSSSNGRLSQV